MTVSDKREIKERRIVRTFSRVFPKGHPREGQPTQFVEKIWNSFRDDSFALPKDFDIREYTGTLTVDQYLEHFNFKDKKYHTIRAGHHFKVGDFLIPRVWSGKPYRSKQIQFAPPLKIIKVWDFDITGHEGKLFINQRPLSECGAYVHDLAENDGLTVRDFLMWFKHPKPFDGQIICWDKSIDYLLTPSSK